MQVVLVFWNDGWAFQNFRKYFVWLLLHSEGRGGNIGPILKLRIAVMFSPFPGASLHACLFCTNLLEIKCIKVLMMSCYIVFIQILFPVFAGTTGPFLSCKGLSRSVFEYEGTIFNFYKCGNSHREGLFYILIYAHLNQLCHVVLIFHW